jgi:hypothetical protein
MPQRKFANQKALIGYAEQNGLVYVWGWIERQRVISPAFTKRKRLLSPDQYEIVDEGPPMPLHAAPRIKRAPIVEGEHLAAPGLLSRVMARLRGL